MLALSTLVAACVPHTPPTSPAATEHTWQITGFRMPAVSALDNAAAEQLRGDFIHLQPHRATNMHQTCDRPSYSEATHATTPFLDTEYRLAAIALGVRADGTVRVIDVTCGGQPWAALGGRVLSFGPGREYAVFEGVFFALRRVHL